MVVVRRAGVAAVSGVEIAGPDATDTALTVDYDGGPIAVPIDYRPGRLGPRTENSLSLRGGSAALHRYVFTGPHDGTLEVDGTPIRFVNLTPINDTVPAAGYTVNLPPGAGTANVTSRTWRRSRRCRRLRCRRPTVGGLAPMGLSIAVIAFAALRSRIALATHRP